MTRRRLGVAAAVVLTVAVATPAVAGEPYCGHGTKHTLTSTAAYLNAYADSHRRHRHIVQVTGHLSSTPRYTAPVCSR